MIKKEVILERIRNLKSFYNVCLLNTINLETGSDQKPCWSTGVSADSKGNIYVTDAVNDKITKINVETGSCENVTAHLEGKNRLIRPWDICIKNEMVYIVDRGNERVLVLDLNFQVLDELNINRFPGIDFSKIAYVFADNELRIYMIDIFTDNIYVLDSRNEIIREFIFDRDKFGGKEQIKSYFYDEAKDIRYIGLTDGRIFMFSLDGEFEEVNDFKKSFPHIEGMTDFVICKDHLIIVDYKTNAFYKISSGDSAFKFQCPEGSRTFSKLKIDTRGLYYFPVSGTPSETSAKVLVFQI